MEKNISSSQLISQLKNAKKYLIENKEFMDKKDNHIYPIINPPFSIPQNWEWVYLSDISIIQEGPGIRKHQYSESGIQFITVTNILEGSVDLEKSTKYMSLDEYNSKYKHFTINKGDIVTACSGATWGKSAIYENDDVLMLNTSTLRLRFFNDLGDNKYLYHLTKSNYFKSNLASHSTGQQPNYGYSHYSKIPIPVPPLPEQKQIVAILDKAFEAIDQAKANIEKNIKNAQELFQSKLNEIFSQKGDGWEEKTILELCEHKSQIVGGPFGSNLKVKDYKEDGVPILRLQNIGKGFFIDKDIKYVSKEKAEELAYHSFECGDIVLAKLGIPIGKTCIVPEKFGYGIVVADVVRIRPNKDIINYDFLKHFLNSDNAVNQLTADIKGATRPRVNIAEVRNLKLSVPLLSEQIKITELIDALENLRNKQVETYEIKISALEELKKSILQKAFAGELTNKELVV